MLALEPSTCYTMGRREERAHGTLQTIKAFGTVRMWVRLKFISMTPQAVADLLL